MKNATSIYLHNSGLWLDFADPQPESIHLDDIGTGLRWEYRFGGNGFSVAEHSIVVALILEQWGADHDTVRAGFVHDFEEAYLRDVPSPGKEAMRSHVLFTILSHYDLVAVALQAAIIDRFKIAEGVDLDAVHAADMEARRLEVLYCFGEGVAYRVYGITDLTPNDAVLREARHMSFVKACERWGIE